MTRAAHATLATPAQAPPSFTPVRRGTLQRCGAGPCTCGCGSDHDVDTQEAGPAAGAGGAVHAALAAPGQPLDGRTRSSLERRFGHDFGRVRVHADTTASAAAGAVQARAFTVGHDVVFGAGQFAPATGAGRRLLAHELAHVAQQGEAPPVGSGLRAAAAGSPEQQADAAERLAGTGGAGPDAAVPAPADAGAPLPAPDAAAPTPADAGPTPDAGAPTPGDAGTDAAPPPPPPPLRWEHVRATPTDALWWFCGAAPTGFSRTAHLRATGVTNATLLAWTITQGADKVEFVAPPAGAEVDVRSKAGSAAADDVRIEVRQGTATATTAGTPAAYVGTLTVRKPDRLVPVSVSDTNGCPPGFPTCPATCPAHWTGITYRVLDNMGATLAGAPVNERFPSAKINDQPNDWVNPASFSSVPSWANPTGTFLDFWAVWCGSPSPLAPGAPGANASVDRLAHEFRVGSSVSGLGCRVQTHTAHRYRGHTRHEAITTPAP